MEDQLVTLETAKLAKEVGFDEPCNYYYIHQFNNTFTNLHGDLRSCDAEDEDGDVIGTYTRRNSKGQPHIIIAPTQSLLQKWLRKVYNSYVYVIPFVDHQADVGDPIEFKVICYGEFVSALYSEWEEALEEGLKRKLKLIKQQTKT